MFISKKLAGFALGLLVSAAGCRGGADVSSVASSDVASANLPKGKLSCELDFDNQHYTVETPNSFESPRQTPLGQYTSTTGMRLRKAANGVYERVLSPAVNTSQDVGLYFIANFTPRITTTDKDSLQLWTQPLSGIRGRGSVILSYVKKVTGQETPTSSFNLADMRINDTAELILEDQKPMGKDGVAYPSYKFTCKLTRVD